MKDVFEEVGLTPDGGNKKEIDRVIHEVVGIEYKACPDVWREVKAYIKRSPEGRVEFVEKLKTRLAEVGIL